MHHPLLVIFDGLGLVLMLMMLARVGSAWWRSCEHINAHRSGRARAAPCLALGS